MAEPVLPLIPFGGGIVAGAALIRTMIDDPALGGPQTGRFEVDMDRLPQLRTDLEDVRLRYMAILNRSYDLRALQAPGEDRVSRRAADELSRWAGDEPGQLGWSSRQAMDRVQEMIDQVDAILLAYRTAEESNDFPR